MKTKRSITRISREIAVGLLVGSVGLLVLAEASIAQTPSFEWVRTAGGSSDDVSFGVAIDSLTNIYVAGYFRGTISFGGLTLASSPSFPELFLAKMNPNGVPLWAKRTGAETVLYGLPSTSEPLFSGRQVAVDSTGNVIFVGNFRGTANLGGLMLASAAPGTFDVFVAKFDGDGTGLWARRGGGLNDTVAITVASGADNSIYIAGWFGNSPISFGTNVLSSSGDADIFLAKLDAGGDFLWARKAGGTSTDHAYALAVDLAGNVIMTGYCIAPANFSGAALGGTGYHIFVAKYDAAGNILWAKDAGGGFNLYGTRGQSVAVDGAGNAYIGGNLQQAQAQNGVLAKYDPDGNLLWGRNPGLSVGAAAVDANGDVYVAGNFRGTMSIGATNATSLGENDIFLTKYNSQGTALWSKTAGLVFEDFPSALAIDLGGNVFMSGSFFDSTTFDSTNITGAGRWDTFITKIPAVTPIAPTITAQPVSQNILAGSNAIFTVTAAGTQPLAYQWRFDSTNLPNQTNATVTITNAQLANEGPYRVVVSNTGGSVTSMVATLTIVFPPSVTSQPQSQIVTAGTDVNFGVTVNGTFPLSYRWQFNGSNIATGTNAILAISNAQPANGGNYTVIVTNAYGAVTSSVATLTVRYSLTVNVTGGGTVTRNPSFSNYPPNLKVTLTASPSAGFVFNFWSGDASGNANPLNVTMTTNKTITANFASTAVTIGIRGEGSVSKSPDRPFYSVGEQVTLTATPGRWFGFTGWGDGPIANPRIITIGTSNSYTAIFSPTTAVETLTFDNVSRTAPVGMPAIFVDGDFVVTAAVTRVETAEVSMLTTFPNGSIFYTLDGSAPDFGRWLYSGPFVLRRSATVRAIAYDADFANAWEADPVQVIIEPTFVVNASAAGGGAVSISPADASYRSNTMVTLSATPAAGWTFLQWLGDASGTSATTSVHVLNRDLCVHALFGTTLGTTVAGNGAVVVEPVAGFYPYGTVVRLTAVPQPGNYFGAWGNAVMSTNNPLLFPVTNANPTVSCAFGTLNAGQAALTVLVHGRGRVTTNPRGNRFPINQSVTVTATADVDQQFLGWSGDATGTSTNLTVLLTQSKIIEANFTARPQLLLGPCLGGWLEDGFQLTLTGELGGHYRIEGSTNARDWTPLTTLTNSFGTLQFTDVLATNRSQQFYRAILEP